MNARHAYRTLVASLLVVLTIIVGFAPKAATQGVPGPALAVQFLDTIAGDAPGYALAPDAVLHAPGGDYAGLEGLDVFRADLAASFSSLQFSLQTSAQAGNLVIASFAMTAINTGTYDGLTVNCAAIAVPGVAMLQVDDASGNALVTEQWISYDTDLIASQIDAFNQIDASVRPGCA